MSGFEAMLTERAREYAGQSVQPRDAAWRGLSDKEFSNVTEVRTSLVSKGDISYEGTETSKTHWIIKKLANPSANRSTSQIVGEAFEDPRVAGKKHYVPVGVEASDNMNTMV